MERPYDKDIELLMGDLNVHSYIAHHYAQEQIEFGKTAERLQEEIPCKDDILPIPKLPFLSGNHV